MATTPALSPEPPTYLCSKPSTKMQIVVPSLKPPKTCVIGVSKQVENLLFTDQNDPDQPDQPFRNQPSNFQSPWAHCPMIDRSKNHHHCELHEVDQKAKRLRL
ncbi:hypothetical protein E4U30_006610 [Claviceps sp. LM220 group G6]|nr:hypothetical protein E4U15_007944 [Claviceps sp. LM218 group G6]KAG6091584.1 hypothetical protein E4U30_006610 [Claviceps sp. LM220 group G6]KAG6103545.1 hypothetical protein E4U31_002752 [Claviceps sp. LM219 group G6]KAG6110533.1 hypothetical protein E4U14_002766 [Claviceps sp. LM454 group G7]